jgi:hypothetical protein
MPAKIGNVFIQQVAYSSLERIWKIQPGTPLQKAFGKISWSHTA